MQKTRVCNLVVRSDYASFGFVLKNNKIPPHQITSIVPNSPADLSGLQDNDMLLKVNDSFVANETYSKIVVLIKNAIDVGRIRLEVVRPEFHVTKDVVGIEVEEKTSDTPLMSSSIKSRNNFENEKSFHNGLNRSAQSLPEYNDINETEKIEKTRQVNEEIVEVTKKKSVSLSNIENIDSRQNTLDKSMFGLLNFCLYFCYNFYFRSKSVNKFNGIIKKHTKI
jgi:hypothetical protein